MLADRVAAGDIGLFAHIESQTTDDDRRSLLAVHNGVATRTSPFSYLEIGSHLGGTLQVVIADERCTRAVSIDPRPLSQPDDRADYPRFEYPGNSTKRMVELLQDVPGADLSKLDTVEHSTSDIVPQRLARPDICFIDGEHTYRAALQDARFCRDVMQGAGIIVFHDFHIVERAILDFLRETPRPHRGYLLATSVFVVELCAVLTLFNDPSIHTQLSHGRAWEIANRARAVNWLLAADIRRRQTML